MSEEEDENCDFNQINYNSERYEYLKMSLTQKTRLFDHFTEEINKLSATIETEKQIIEKIDSYAKLKNLKPISPRENQAVDNTVNHSDYALTQKLPPLYNTFRTSDITSSLRPEIDFTTFFRDFPLALIALFDKRASRINFRAIFEQVERWDMEPRIKFAHCFFHHLEQAATLVGLINSVTDFTNIIDLCDFVETQLPKIINVRRAIFMNVDDDKLILHKQRLQFASQLRGGTVTRCVSLQEQLVLTRLSMEEETEDAEMMRMNSAMLATPIDTHPQKQKDKVTENRKKLMNEKLNAGTGRLFMSSKDANRPLFVDSSRSMSSEMYGGQMDSENAGAVLLLFDCTGGFHTSDILIAKVLGRAIGECLPIINMRNKYNNSKEMLQNTLDVLMDVAATNDTKELLAVAKKSIPKYFQCEDVNIFRVLPDGRFFSLSKPDEIYSSRTGLVGEAIYSKRTMTSADPELSVHYNKVVDSKDQKSTTRSILTCPVFGQDDEHPVYAVVLYNKIHIDSFSQAEIMTLEMFCQNISNIFQSASDSQQLAYLVKSAKDIFAVNKRILEFIRKITQTSDVNTLNKLIVDEMEEILNCEVTLYVVNEKQKMITSLDPFTIFQASLNDQQNPYVVVYNKKEPMESYSDNDSDVSYIFPLENGLISIKKKPKGTDLLETGVSKQGIIGSSSSNNKSMLEIKIQKLDLVQEAKVRHISNQKLVRMVSPWIKVVSPLLSLALSTENDTKSLLRYSFLSLNLPKDDNVSFNILKDICKDKEEEFNIFPTSKKSEVIHGMMEECVFDAQIETEKFIFPRNISLLLNYNVFEVTTDLVEEEILSIIKTCGMDKFIVNNIQFHYFLQVVRDQHSQNKFTNFLLCIDHVQFAAVIIKSIENKTVNHFAILLYLLALYCNVEPETVIFTAEASCKSCPFKCDREELYKCIGSFSKDYSFGVLFDADVCQLICAICRYSYLIRSMSIVKKHIDLRFAEEDEKNPEVQSFIIETEVRSFIVPCCGELMKRGIKSDSYRKLFTTNSTNLTNISF